MHYTTPTIELYDGPFKVPLPRKVDAKSKQGSGRESKLRMPKPHYKKVDQHYKSYVYQKLLVKLIEAPERISKYEMKILSTHPMIRRLLKCSRNSEMSNASFYIPIETLLNPQMYVDTEVPVIYESTNQKTDGTHPTKVNSDEILDEDIADESTSSNHDAEEYEEKRIGKYTMKERQERIKKYKAKLLRYKQNNPSKKVTRKPRKHTKTQGRKNGTFTSFCKTPEELSGLLCETGESVKQSCAAEYSDVTKSDANLNDMVSEITGIYSH